MVVVSAMYKFMPLEHIEELKVSLLSFLEEQGIRGTLLLTKEGVNGTVAGSDEAIEALHDFLPKLLGTDFISHKESYHDAMPFNRCKVKLKKEIVTMGVEGIDPRRVVGTYVKPQDWNALISSSDVTLIDTRNDYEVNIGTFKNAINPDTQNFREFPAYVNENLDPKKHKKVAMFCTGGIRCEKSTALLKEQGFEEVYHLEGGILKYLEEVPEQESLWQGECFVFDERVAVNHQLEKGQYDQCHACRYPVTEKDKNHEDYVQGVSCPRCAKELSEEQIKRFQEREKQCRLAKERKEPHIGSLVSVVITKRRITKQLAKKESSTLKIRGNHASQLDF